MGSTNDPSSPQPSLADELAALARGLRAQLGWRKRGGAYAAEGGSSPRTGTGTDTVTDTVTDTDTDTVTDTVTDTGTGTVTDTVTDTVTASGFDRATAADPGHRSLPMIRADLGDCQRCKLSTTRTHIVFGVGPETADLMFIGEGPGADEDRTGEPFVGKAGQLLDKMIEAMGWARGDVYIANVVKCRPPGNRNPEPDEIAACRPFLEAQITSVRPRIIVTLGKPAANLVLGTDATIGSLRGTFHEYRGLRVMPTYHPAYLLREPDRKRDAWSDLKQVIAELERLGVAPPRR